VINLSPTTNFSHLACKTFKFFVSCEYSYIPDQQRPTILTNRF
ncbi:unnamed protein product, partial [Porites evermanni]